MFRFSAHHYVSAPPPSFFLCSWLDSGMLSGSTALPSSVEFGSTVEFSDPRVGSGVRRSGFQIFTTR